jgi:hypothetical protein
VLDSGGPDAVAVTLEADGSGSIYPVLFTRLRGATAEHVMEADPALRYDGAEARKAIDSVLRQLPLGGA